MRALAVLALLGLVSPGLAAEPVRAWQGSRTVVKTKHLQPHLGEGEDYGEKYTFNADFGEKGSFYFSMTIANLGMGDHKMEAKGRLSIDGKKITWKKKLDDDEWKHAKGEFRIKAGSASIEGTPDALLLKAKGKGGEFELNFTPIARAWRPRNGQVLFGKDQKAADFTVFPLMKVEGRYKADGDWIPISGTGFGSHSWSDIAIYEQARMSREFRGISGDATIYLREFTTPAEYGNTRVVYLIVTKGEKLLIESFDFVTQTTASMTDSKHDNKYVVPESFTIQGFDAEGKDRQFRGKITKKKLRKRKDMLKSMGAAVRMVASRYSKPVRYEYDSDFHVEVKTPEGVEQLKGVGRYEVYHWNK